MLKVVCFKWKHTSGYKLASLYNIEGYTAGHVNNLHKAVSLNLSIPHEFICITDDPTDINCKTIPLWDKCREYGGCYNRLYVFSKDMKDIIGDRFVCIDLDCVITGNLDPLFDHDLDFVINSYYGPQPKQYYNGGLFLMDAGVHDNVWTEFEKDIPGNIELLEEERKQGNLLGTDQAWISHILGPEKAVYECEDGVIPYRLLKRRGKQSILPDHAKMVFFAGNADPSTVQFTDKWVREYWRCNYIIKENGFDQLETLSQKVQWLKHFYYNPIMPDIVDKIKVNDYVIEKLGEEVANSLFIPTLSVGNNVHEIPFEDIPQPYIVKPTHLSGAFIRVDGDLKKKLPFIKHYGHKWLNTTYGHKSNEWVYYNLKPQLMVQKHLPLNNGYLPEDYKLHMINGKCEFIQIYSERPLVGKGEAKQLNYTPDWELIPVLNHKYEAGKPLPKPPALNRAIEIAEKLAEPFDYVRVDLFLFDHQIYFGELTFFPHGGHFNFTPETFDYEMGSKLKLIKSVS